MKLNELLNMAELLNMLEQKFVKVNSHPIYPNIKIYEYTNEAMFGHMWNDITRKCRGLVVDTSTMEVLARPFDKFFNHNEPDAPVLDLDSDLDDIKVTDKLDGSMGILYQRPDGFWEITTKGSFQSEQGSHATLMLHQQYGEFLNNLDTSLTYMFEIIYPSNRIVVNYGAMDALVLIGARDIETGDTFGPDELSEWTWEKATTFSYKTLREALEAPPRDNAEGYVVYSSSQDVRVKIKQEDYLRLHKTISGLTERNIWENLASGMTYSQMARTIPEEFHTWLRDTVDVLVNRYNRVQYQVMADYHDILSQFPVSHSRKDFASLAVKKQYPGLLFAKLDRRDMTGMIWKIIRPTGE